MSDRRRTRTPSRTVPAEAEPARRSWTVAEVRALGTVTDIVTAGQIFGLSRNTSYRLARAGTFPVPVIKAGARYVVPLAAILAAVHAHSGCDCQR